MEVAERRGGSEEVDKRVEVLERIILSMVELERWRASWDSYNIVDLVYQVFGGASRSKKLY